MFENISYEKILQEKIERALLNDPNLDTREGSIIFDTLAPNSIEQKQLYMAIDRVMDETFADTATRAPLIRRASERGIRPQPSTKAILKGLFNMDIPLGSRFSLEKLNYTVIEKIDTNIFKLECESFGIIGNQSLGLLIPIDYFQGLETAILTELLIPGEDEEETESLRSRYFKSLESEAFGGNVADYKEKTNAMHGVGGVKVYPVWAGGGTVKLVVINSDYAAPTNTLIVAVQTTIDPVSNSGKGVGLAPIGHKVTVTGVTNTTINITSNITYQVGWSWEEIRVKAEQTIDKYFKELAKSWADNQNLIIRISQIEIRILDLGGIIDIAGTTINGLEQNFMLEADNIPMRGTLHG